MSQYLLSFDGVNDYVRLPDFVSDEYEVILDFAAPPQTDRRIFCRARTTDTAFFGVGSGNTTGTNTKLRIFGGGTTSQIGTADVFDGNRHTVRIRIEGGVLNIYVDGSPTPDITSNVSLHSSTDNFTIWVFGAVVRNVNLSVAAACDMDLYSASVELIDGPLTETYNPSLSSGAGTVLPTASGNNNGTLVNFDVPACWVLIPSAGVTADAAVTAKKPTVLSDATVAVPAPSASIAVNAKKPTVASSITAALPQPDADITVTAKKPSASASITAELPIPVGTVAVTAKKPTVSAQADVATTEAVVNVSVTAKKPVVSSSIAATLPQPSTDIVVTAKKPTASASVNVELNLPVANIAVTAKKPTVLASGAATLPQPIVSLFATAKKPTVTSLVIVGEVVIIPTSANSIYEPALSNVIYERALSNRIYERV